MDKTLSWKVKYFDMNSQTIKDYDVLKHRYVNIKHRKKECKTKEKFSESMRRAMVYHYWGKSEWELIIEVDNENHVWLKPWVGCREPEKVKIDVTNEKNFDWKKFAAISYSKIDVFDQLCFMWEEFIDYCWNFHFKYERRKKEN